MVSTLRVRSLEEVTRAFVEHTSKAGKLRGEVCRIFKMTKQMNMGMDMVPLNTSTARCCCCPKVTLTQNYLSKNSDPPAVSPS